MKLSVVITAFNEEKKIEDCLQSVKKIASEIILIDSSSTDSTVSKAKKYTDKIYTRDNNPMLNINKNFGFSKTAGDWILSLDADERVTDELSQEILKIDENDKIDGYFIPRKNIIFGKWIENTGWYPDYQLRLFRKDKGRFAEKHVHEMVTVDGVTSKLENPITHLNYDNVSQFLNKMIKNYTISEAENLISNGYKYNPLDIIRMPLGEFIKRYYAQKGYKDGMHGLVLSFLQAFYYFVIFIRIWEANNFPDEKTTTEILKNGGKLVRHEINHWMYEQKLENEKSAFKKQLFRIQRKVKI